MTGHSTYKSILNRPLKMREITLTLCGVLALIALFAAWDESGQDQRLHQDIQAGYSDDNSAEEKLFFASCKNGQTEVVERYLADGMDPNLPHGPQYAESYSRRPLAFAIESDNPATCEVLIKAGAKLFPCGGLHAIGYAAAVNKPRMVDYLIKRAGISDSPVAVQNALHYALRIAVDYTDHGENEDVIDYVIARGLDPNRPMPQARSLADWAIAKVRERGNAGIMKKLQQWQQAGRNTVQAGP